MDTNTIFDEIPEEEHDYMLLYKIQLEQNKKTEVEENRKSIVVYFINLNDKYTSYIYTKALS